MSKTEQKTNANPFENLKKLNNIISGKGFNSIFAEIKSSKQNLDSFCKTAKDKINVFTEKAKQDAKALEALNKKAEVKHQAEVKVVETSNVQESKTSSQNNYGNNRSSQNTQFNNTDQSKNSYVNRPTQNSRQGQHTTFTKQNDNRSGYNRDNNNSGYNRDGRQCYNNQNYNRDNNVSYNNANANNRAGSNSQGYNKDYNRSYTPRTGNDGKPYTPRTGNDGRPYTPRTGSDGRPYTPRNGNDGRPYTPRAGNDGKPYTPRTGNDGRPYTTRTGNDGRPYQQRAGADNKGAKPKSFETPTVSFTAKKESSLGTNKAKTKSNAGEKKGLNVKEKMRLGLIKFEDSLAGDDDRVIKIKNSKKQKQAEKEKVEITNAIITEDVLTVKILSEKIGKPAAEIIKKFFLLGLMYNINSVIDYPTAELVAGEFNVTLEHKIEKSYEEKLEDMFNQKALQQEDEQSYVKRPPIVTVMGHVDHGKTSLLDFIKKSHVVSGEAGGITQHIGAYSIKLNNEDITFIDTPGHEAFFDMRSRGATVADVAILIVAADDGIKPQTVEAIKHIKEAKTPMIVAVNKIDKPEANIERVKQQLTEHEILVEEWGGDVICVPISAKSGQGIDKLLEMILLVADVNDLKANPNKDAIGLCLESKVDIGKGVVATIIVKDGTLKVGDYIICGMASGRIRSMTNYLGESINAAGPSMAVSVVGLNSVPGAGEMAYVVDEKMAKNIVSERGKKLQAEKIQQSSGTTLESFLQQSADVEIKTYKVIVKSDVQGTNEALVSTLESIKNEEVVVSVISSSVGVVNENDVMLAKASNALIIAFNTKIDNKARIFADKNEVEIKNYKIIYEAMEYVSSKIEKMKSPKFKEQETGKVEVRQLFKISSLGVIAGSYVLEGYISRTSLVKVLRNNEVLITTTVDTLQQQKDMAKQVRSGFECGIKLKGFNDIKVGDILVAFENIQVN